MVGAVHALHPVHWALGIVLEADRLCFFYLCRPFSALQFEARRCGGGAAVGRDGHRRGGAPSMLTLHHGMGEGRRREQSDVESMLRFRPGVDSGTAARGMRPVGLLATLMKPSRARMAGVLGLPITSSAMWSVEHKVPSPDEELGKNGSLCGQHPRSVELAATMFTTYGHTSDAARPYDDQRTFNGQRVDSQEQQDRKGTRPSTELPMYTRSTLGRHTHTDGLPPSTPAKPPQPPTVQARGGRAPTAWRVVPTTASKDAFHLW